MSKYGLVLSGGGARAAYQVGALCALTDVHPDVAFPIITGVSAGAINMASLACTEGTFAEATAQLHARWEVLTAEQVYAFHSGGVALSAVRWLWQAIARRRDERAVVHGLMDMSPLREFLRFHMDLDGIARNVAAGRIEAAALSSTSYSTGCTVTFVQGREGLPTWERVRRYSTATDLTIDHIIASAAIPIVFQAVRLGDQYFGDGSVRQTAPLAPAIHLGADRLVAISMRDASGCQSQFRPEPDYPSAAELGAMLLHSIFLDALDADAERLERVNRLLEDAHDGRERRDERLLKLLMLRPSRDLGDMASGMPGHVPPLVSALVNAIGGRRVQSSDFWSYLLFDPAYTGPLMELGYEDTLAERGRIEDFFA